MSRPPIIFWIVLMALGAAVAVYTLINDSDDESSTELPTPTPTPGSSAAGFPESQRYGVLGIAHPNPIYQNITRTAFMHVGAGDLSRASIHFSTLERDKNSNQYPNESLVYKYDIQSGQLTSAIITGSTEARSYAFSKAHTKYVLGGSLGPQVLLYDPDDQRIESVFSEPGLTAFVHQLATSGDDAYTVISARTLTPELEDWNGILKINIHTTEWEVIPFQEQLEQAWGGVQSVDPYGRIWFWRGLPKILKWYDEDYGIQERQVDGYEEWVVAGWDTWGDDYFLILIKDEGQMRKIRVDPVTLRLKDADLDPASQETKLFLDLMPVDLDHRGNPPLRSLYYHPQTFEYYEVNTQTMNVALRGTLATNDDSSENQLLRVSYPYAPAGSETSNGLFEELGLVGGEDLIVWSHGGKRYGVLDLNEGDFEVESIDAPNLSPATITSLAVGNDGYLYGGGGLTMSDLFRFDPASNEVTLLEQAIPYGEGQVNSLFDGLDGNIYGAGYPGSVIFKYDPSLPWRPGSDPSSNPVNMGSMGYYNQQRAYWGIQDLDGNIWYESIGDYFSPVIHALARVDFANMSMVVKTGTDDGFPIVKELTVFDDTRIIFLGEQEGTHKLYLVNQRDFVIEKQKAVPKDDGVLLNLDTQDAKGNNLLFAQENTLYRIDEDLSLEPIHTSKGPILRLVRGDQGEIVVVGEYHIEVLNVDTGDWQVWWDKTDVREQNLIPTLHWNAVVFHEGVLFIGVNESLKKFIPPR